MKKLPTYVVVNHMILVEKTQVESVIQLLQTENVGEVYQFGANIKTPTKKEIAEYKNAVKAGQA